MTPAPLFERIAEGPAGGRAWWLTTDDGVRIRLGLWPGGGAGTALIFPGRTEYVEKYGRAAADLAARGFAVAAIDWRGQGLAERASGPTSLGHVEAFADYQRDIAAVRAALPRLAVPRPLFLLAHSMGGAIGLRALAGGLDVVAAVFSAPMWGLALSPLLDPAARLITGASRRLGLGARPAPGAKETSHLAERVFETNVLTADRGMFDYMQAQIAAQPELALGGPSLSWVSEALRETHALADFPAPHVPALTLLGTEESVVDPEAIARRMAGWPGGRMERIPGARHEVMMAGAATRAHVFDTIAAHFTANTPAPAAN